MSIFKSFLTLCKYHLFDSWKQFYFSLIILSAFIGLIYSYRLIDILRRDRPLRFLSWALLAISIAIQPVAIYFVAKTIQGNHPDQTSRTQVGNYTAKEEFAPIFYALCGKFTAENGRGRSKMAMAGRGSKLLLILSFHRSTMVILENKRSTSNINDQFWNRPLRNQPFKNQ